MYLRKNLAEMLVKFQSDQTILNINLAGLRQQEFLCEVVLLDIETIPSTACQAFAWAYMCLSTVVVLCQGGMGSANETQRYIVTLCLIGWAHTQSDLCLFCPNCSWYLSTLFHEVYQVITKKNMLSKMFP